MDNGSYFNQSHYQDIPNNEVNWAMLAQQWIHQNRPNPDNHEWSQPFHRPLGPPQPGPVHGGPPRYFNNQASQQLGPIFNNYYPPQRPYPPRQYPPRMDFFQGPPQHSPYPHQMPLMGRPPSLFDVRPQWNPEFAPHSAPPMHERQPPAPLFPSAANTRPTERQPLEQDPYNWPEQNYSVAAPPPPPPPTWLDSNGTKDHGDYSTLDTNERKQLPAWIREGLEQMEREKRMREEKEERRKLLEAAEKSREEARKAKGKSKFDSDSEEDEVEKEPVRRKFEEYPDRGPISDVDKERLTNEAVKSVLIELLLESTKKLLKKCAENALASQRTNQGSFYYPLIFFQFLIFHLYVNSFSKSCCE
jgi:hypothetical protein